jgi:hypothetical protein
LKLREGRRADLIHIIDLLPIRNWTRFVGHRYLLRLIRIKTKLTKFI